MNDIIVIKAAHNLRDGVCFANVGKELVAQAFAFGCTSNEAGDVHKFHGGRQDAFGFDDGGQRIQSWIGHVDNAGIWFNGAEGVVLGVNACVGQGIEEGGLADIWQADDAAVESHMVCPLVSCETAML